MANATKSVSPEIWSDLHQDLVGDAQGTLKKVINADSVKTSIDNIIRTWRGERVFLPQFGSTLRDMLFEPINDYLADEMAKSVREAIETWDDRVSVLGVDTQVDTDNNFVSITVRFRIKSFTEVFTHSVDIVQ